MIDWTKPIETVDGRAAKLLSRGYWRNGETYCVVQFEEDDGNSEIVIVNPTTGYHAWSHKGPFRNVRVKREGWGRVIKSGAGMPMQQSDVIFATKESAEAACQKLGGYPAFMVWEE